MDLEIILFFAGFFVVGIVVLFYPMKWIFGVNAMQKEGEVKNVGLNELIIVGIVISIFFLPIFVHLGWPNSILNHILFAEYRVFIFYAIAYSLLFSVARIMDKKSEHKET